MSETFSVQGGSDLTVGWREFISKTGSTQTSHWLNDGSGITMTLDSSFPNRETVIQEVLGYSFRTGQSLSRHLPMRHPDYEWMYATSLDMNGVNWTNKYAGNGAGPFSYYDVNRTRITFNALPFDVYPDNSGNIVGGSILPDGTVVVNGEWNRFVIKNRKPTTEFAATDRLNMKWGAGTPSAGKTIKTNVGFKLPTVTLTWKWMFVPDDYLNDQYGNSINVEASLGTVNNAWFAGFNPQTLYLDSVDYESVMLPVDPRTVLGYPAGKPPRAWNVTLNLKYRNPPVDNRIAGATARGYTVGGDTIGGHNLLPDLSKPITASTLVANLASSSVKLGWFWYPAVTVVGAATTDGTGEGGAYLFSQSDFTRIFKPVDPS